MNFAIALEKVIQGEGLDQSEAYELMRDILEGKLLPTQAAGMLAALRTKGESVDEVVGFVSAMRDAMVTIGSRPGIVADTCGTGGDGTSTFNISTAAAFVVAGAGVPVAKHGNRSVSSRSGSADLLEALGVKIDMTQKAAERCLNEIGITFLFAPLYHPAMKNVAAVRKELGIRTVFNLIGPLSNPARADAQVLGVPKKDHMKLFSEVLRKLSVKQPQSALVVHESGHDEMILAGTCSIHQVSNGKSKAYSLAPSKLKLRKTHPRGLRGGSAEDNAKVLRSIFQGEDQPLKEVVIANAALALYAAELARKNPKPDFADCAQKARESILSGAALQKMNDLVQWSRKGD